MQQVVVNLIMNAAEAAQNKPDGKVTVTTSIDETNHQMKFQVIDNGEGISDENLSKIFSPFFTTKGEGKGVGLGLAVVFGIIEAHKGDIDVQSTMHVGTTFTVKLPFEDTSDKDRKPEDQKGIIA